MIVSGSEIFFSSEISSFFFQSRFYNPNLQIKPASPVTGGVISASSSPLGLSGGVRSPRKPQRTNMSGKKRNVHLCRVWSGGASSVTDTLRWRPILCVAKKGFNGIRDMTSWGSGLYQACHWRLNFSDQKIE